MAANTGLKIGLIVGREWSFPPAFIEEVNRRDEGVTAEYVPGIVHEESLRNLVYPLDWQGIIDYVGLPCVLKDAHGGGWRDVFICHTLDDLIYRYNGTGRMTMVVQEFITWDQFVSCICLGQEDVLPVKYDPRERRYHVEHEHLSPELGERIVGDSLKLVRALGYDMNSMEWAVRDGVPYAIDFMNPAPDLDINSLTPHYFEWAVKKMADMAVRMAKAPRTAPDLQRGEFLLGRRHPATPVAELGAQVAVEAAAEPTATQPRSRRGAPRTKRSRTS